MPPIRSRSSQNSTEQEGRNLLSYPDDIYNFDETGFVMGLTATAKVITRSEYYGQRSLLQPANCEWVTAIEVISVPGWALPPCIIFKGKVFIEGWFDNLPGDWRFEVSPNGWTSDEIGLQWLQRLFIPSTITRTKGKYRLLILDGHASHLILKFAVKMILSQFVCQYIHHIFYSHLISAVLRY